jgi:hypothetical protein
MSPTERLATTASELTMYGLMFVQPLVGWGMLSAARYPIVLYRSLGGNRGVRRKFVCHGIYHRHDWRVLNLRSNRAVQLSAHSKPACRRALRQQKLEKITEQTEGAPTQISVSFSSVLATEATHLCRIGPQTERLIVNLSDSETTLCTLDFARLFSWIGC